MKPSWRWEDQEQALLTACSSLIAIVSTGRSRVVQFSHFSVKEFLTSARLATSGQDVSRYHISLGPAHAILAQACLSILLQLDDLIGHTNTLPLARYAAEHWVRHAQFEDVVSCIKGVETLFDPDRPYFATWYQLHDIDTFPSDDSVFFQFRNSSSTRGNTRTPLYYAALCGFPNLVEQLIVKHPQHVNAIGGYYMTAAVAALVGRHFQLAQVLCRNGSSVDPRGGFNKTPLHSAAYYGDLEMVQVLLNYGADVNAQTEGGSTPLCFTLGSICNNADPRVVRLLLDHGADPNVRATRLGMLNSSTALHLASRSGKVEIVRLLVEHGASVEAEDGQGTTPLDVALRQGGSATRL